jgi:hypothetical protein
MQTLTMDEISLVSGGDKGDATAGGAIAGGLALGNAGLSIARAAGLGAMRGLGFGLVGVVAGAALFGGIAYFSYAVAMK